MYANNIDAGQPAHLRSLISTFVIRLLERIIFTLAPMHAKKSVFAVGKDPSIRVSAAICHQNISMEIDVMTSSLHHRNLIDFTFTFALLGGKC